MGTFAAAYSRRRTRARAQKWGGVQKKMIESVQVDMQLARCSSQAETRVGEGANGIDQRRLVDDRVDRPGNDRLKAMQHQASKIRGSDHGLPVSPLISSKPRRSARWGSSAVVVLFGVGGEAFPGRSVALPFRRDLFDQIGRVPRAATRLEPQRDRLHPATQ